ncbi:MAG TPA: protein kinase [Chloroflexia bacterium]|nr:protein kinase [Chloroflexia bacterium]
MKTLGKYELRGPKPLGEGYFGVTWLAWDRVHEENVALKVFKNPERGLEDLKREVKPLLQLRHKNVIGYKQCDYYRDDVGNDVFYIATEYADQGTLRNALGSLYPEMALDYCVGILNGLSACHKRSILHRDLKPENIFIKGNVIKVGDLGIAVITDHTILGNVSGTWQYMAPEQLDSRKKTSRRTDLWAVGVILYEMLYKKRPFASEEEIKNPGAGPKITDIPGYRGLSQILQKALAKDETKRFQSCEEFIRALQEISFNRMVTVMIAEQGIVGWDYDGEGYEYRDFEIIFKSSFKSPPIVHASFSMLDTSPIGDTTTRCWVEVSDINSKRAKIKVGTWNKNKLWGCKVTWLAVGN